MGREQFFIAGWRRQAVHAQPNDPTRKTLRFSASVLGAWTTVRPLHGPKAGCSGHGGHPEPLQFPAGMPEEASPMVSSAGPNCQCARAC
jgi:hypothetical protein